MLIGFNRILKRNNHDLPVKDQLLRLVFMLFMIISLHITAMMMLEKMSFMDALWLTITSITTVGYGDLYAQSIYGRLATIVLIYISGIAILAQVAVMYFEHQQYIRNSKLRGDWSWKMKNHIVFLNSPKDNGEEYFFRTISEIRNSNSELSKAPIIIVSEVFEDGISKRLRKLHVSHVRNNVTDPKALEDANINAASIIIILTSDQNDVTSDSIHFDLIDRIRESNLDARIITEVVNDVNRSRLKRAGANNVIRPIRSYPELLSRTVIAPGSEQILESLFDNFGVQCVRYNIEAQTKWLNVIENLTKNDFGLPIAYEDNNNKIIVSPSANEDVNTKAIFIISNEGKIKDIKKIQNLIS